MNVNTFPSFFEVDTSYKLGSGTYGQVFGWSLGGEKTALAIKTSKTKKESYLLYEAKMLQLIQKEEITKGIVEFFGLKPAVLQGRITQVLVLKQYEFSLEEYLNKLTTGRISLENTFSLLKTLGETLSFLHRKNIVHGDLKPQNILMTQRTGQMPCFAISDFGLSFVQGKCPFEYLQSFSYLSPEVILNRKAEWGPALDIWSLAVICVEVYRKNIADDCVDVEISNLKLLHESVLGCSYQGAGVNGEEYPEQRWKNASLWNVISPSTEKSSPELLEKELSLYQLLQEMFSFNPKNRMTASLAFCSAKKVLTCWR